MYTLFAALSALTYGFADFSGGLAARKSPVSAVVAWSQAIGIPVAVLAAPLIGTSIPTMEVMDVGRRRRAVRCPGAWISLQGPCGRVCRRRFPHLGGYRCGSAGAFRDYFR